MNLLSISEHCANYTNAKKFLREKNILRSVAPRCGECHEEMSEIKFRQISIWRCKRHHGRKVSVREGSFLSGRKIEFEKFIMLSYTWAVGISVSGAASLTGLSKASTGKWFSMLRHVCSHHLSRNSSPETHDFSETSSLPPHFRGHVDDFVWRQRYAKSHQDAFDNILLHISQWYRVH